MRGAVFQYDDTNMHYPAVGTAGITRTEWEKGVPALHKAKQIVLDLAEDGEQGFANLPFEQAAFRESTALADHIQKRFTDVVVLGIGGSDLGARMLVQALADQHKQPIRVHFAGSSTDPDEVARTLASVNIKHTCINIVSKSGGTLEPMASFLVFRDRLIRAVGKEHMPAHIVATTDPSDGALRALAEQEGYMSLTIPSNVGGRFSALSSVGLFPAALAGIDVKKLLQGGRDAVSSFRHTPVEHCAVSRYAGLHTWAFKQGMPIHVLVPYTPKLREFGAWVRQLVGESLGKKKSTKSTKPVGITPVACLGPEDQHSQLQLWSEGPLDKVITFLEVQKFTSDLRTPVAPGIDPVIARFGGKKFSDLVHIERAATAEALRQDRRPNGTITLPRMDAETLGRLILFFELAVAQMGEVLGVDPYNQPGVEKSKKIMKEALA